MSRRGEHPAPQSGAVDLREPAVPWPIGRDRFVGQCFEDAPEAAIDRGSWHMPARPASETGRGSVSALSWAIRE